MILGDKVDKITAEIKERKPHEGIRLNIGISDVSKNENQLSIKYRYEVSYEGVGYISIEGTVIAEEDEKTTNEILESWKSKGAVPKSYMERLLNAINFSGTSHATIVARVLNYPPPLTPPRLTISERKEEPKQKKKKSQ